MTDRAIINISRTLIIVADHTKCGRVSTAFVAPLGVIHTFVTGVETLSEFNNGLTNLGIQAITA